jgi:hypothetical protein
MIPDVTLGRSNEFLKFRGGETAAVKRRGREFVFLVGNGGARFAGLKGGPEGVGAGNRGRYQGGVGY